MFTLIAMAPPPTMEVEDYIFELANGDMQAMGLLYKAASPSVYAFALSVLKNTQDAQDVLHDTFVSVYTGAGSYRSSGKPMAWIITVTRNLCLKRLKDRDRTTQVSLEDWRDHLQLCTEMTTDDKVVLSQCMVRLSDDERQIVVLHAVAGFKHREIGQMMDLALPTVLSKYHRAIKKLREYL